MEIASCSYVFPLTKDISVSYSYLFYHFGTGGHTQKAKPVLGAYPKPYLLDC